MRKTFLAMATLVTMGASAQLSESFADGDFTSGTVWGGDASDWAIEADSDVAAGAAGSNTLRLAAPGGSSGTAYLSTQVPGSCGTQQTWGFWLGRRGQAATASNASFVWLYASEADINSPTVDGYRVRFGDDGGNDPITLESVTNGTATIILSSTGEVSNGLTDIGLLVRVTRNASGQWSLFTSALPGSGGSGAVATDIPNAINANQAQGTVSNTDYTSFDNGYVAFAALHSTSAAARQAAEFDQLLFSFAGGATLPVKFGKFRAEESSAGIQLSWSNETESEVENYLVERSADGRNYSAIANIDPKGNTGGNFDYRHLDRSPAKGNNFYRIRVNEITGKFVYSDVVRISLGMDGGSALSVYPNPVRAGDKLSIQLSDLPSGDYTMRVMNMNSQAVVNRSMSHTGGAVTESLSLGHLRPGIYVLEVRGEGVKVQKQFIVQ